MRISLPQLAAIGLGLGFSNWRPAITDMEAQKQRRLDAVARAERLAAEARK